MSLADRIRASQPLAPFSSTRRCWLTLVLAACLGFTASDTDAAVVYLKSKPDPVVGYLERIDDNVILIRQRDEDGIENLVTIPKADVADLLLPIDEVRLQSLHPSSVHEYRDYAEELAVKRMDPEAIDMAVRLYLIVAKLGDSDLKQSAFRALIDLARNPQEGVHFRALAYRLLPERNRMMLQKPQAVSVTVGSLTTRQRADMADAIRLLRNEQFRQASEMANSEPVEQAFEAFESTLTLESFRNVCSRRELPDGLRETLLQIEIALISPNGTEQGPADPSQASDETWGQTVIRAAQPLRIVTLERVTEFDPNKSLYRDGEWVMP